MQHLGERRKYTKERIEELKKTLQSSGIILADKACVYATGSFGRLEAGKESDLDLFIVGKTSDLGPEGKKRQLSRLDEICVKADLIEASRSLKFPDFDGDGKYLEHYTVDDLTQLLGQPEDDANNTLTGRLLLFLESQPLLGEDVYKDVIDEVIAAYWRDYEDHKSNFMPAYLTNDILRLWRTFCVNYEARTQREPDDKKIKGKIKNYKLKHSRMLTCYSALLYLLCVFKEEGTVSPKSASFMTQMTPTERIEWLLEREAVSDAHDKVRKLLAQYEKFLENTSKGEEHLKAIFADPQKGAQYMTESYQFGDLVYDALCAIGEGQRFFRLIVV